MIAERGETRLFRSVYGNRLRKIKTNSDINDDRCYYFLCRDLFWFNISRYIITTHIIIYYFIYIIFKIFLYNYYYNLTCCKIFFAQFLRYKTSINKSDIRESNIFERFRNKKEKKKTLKISKFNRNKFF